MTTRNCIALAAAIVAGGLEGCATRGPLHVYSIAANPTTVLDLGDENASAVPSFLAPGESVIGFAYDPFTDHFFLRLAPGNRIRVIDRPARAIKRELELERVPPGAAGSRDLAVRPRDGHLFATHPTAPALIELTRFGRFVREIPLERLTSAPAGVAYDSLGDRLLVLDGDDTRRVSIHDLVGRVLGAIPLARRVDPSLAFDSEQRELYAPLAGEAATIAVFDETGKLVRTLPQPGRFVDVGPRSLVRVF